MICPKAQNILRILAIILVLFLLDFSFPSPPFACASDQWPMYQANPTHTGFIPVSLDPARLALRWQKNLGSLPLNPVTAAGGRVFVSSKAGLFALDSITGDTDWSTSFGNVFSVNPPSYADGNVYIQTDDEIIGSYLRAYDAATGDLVFRSGFLAQWEWYYAPTIYEGKVYIDGGRNGGMYCFDGTGGVQDWYTALPQYDEWTPAVDENWAYAYVGEYSPALYVVDRLTGQPVFDIPDPNFVFSTWSMNLAPVLGGLSDVFAIQDGRLIRFDLANRDIDWAISANFTGQPTVVRGVVYAVSSGALGAYDQKTGALEWMWEAPNGETLEDNIIAANSYLFVRSAATTYCIDPAGRKAVWSYPAAGHLSLAESTLYCGLGRYVNRHRPGGSRYLRAGGRYFRQYRSGPDAHPNHNFKQHGRRTPAGAKHRVFLRCIRSARPCAAAHRRNSPVGPD